MLGTCSRFSEVDCGKQLHKTLGYYQNVASSLLFDFFCYTIFYQSYLSLSKTQVFYKHSRRVIPLSNSWLPVHVVKNLYNCKFFLLSTSFDLQKRGRGRPKGSRTKPNSSMYYKFSKNRTAKVKKGLKSDTETVQPIVSSLHVCGTLLCRVLGQQLFMYLYLCMIC